MSSINGAGDGTAFFQQMQKNFSELEEELQNQKKAQRKRADEEISDIEARYKKGMARAESKMTQTIENNRESSRENMERERAILREQVRQSRDELYDRLGRQARAEQQEVNNQLARAVHENEELTNRARETVDKTESRASEKLRNSEEDFGRKLSDSLQKQSDSSEESVAAAIANQKAVSDEFKRDALVRMKDMAKRQEEDRKFAEHNARRGVDDAMKAASKMVHETERHQAEKARYLDEKRTQAALGEAQAASASRRRETQELREKLNVITELSRDVPKLLAEKQREMVRIEDQSRRQREEAIMKAYEDQIFRLKNNADERESNLVSGAQERMHEQELDVRKRIDTQNHDHMARLNEMRREYENREESTAILRRYEQKLNDRKFDRITDRMLRDRNAGLMEQAQAYQETIDRNRQVAADEQLALKRQISNLKDPEQIDNISPAAERAIRAQFEVQNKERLDAELDRHNRAMEEQQLATRGKLNQTLHERDRTLAEFQRMAETNRYLDRATFGNLIEELTEDTQKKMARQDDAFQRQITQQGKLSAQNAEELKYTYEDAMRDREDQAVAKVREVRENAQHQARLNLRENASRTADLIRQYEKKINEIQSTHKEELAAIKGEKEKTVREAEKRLKIQMEEQARTYEHRIAALEQQHDERAKIIARNYEDQLDRVRNANEQILRRRNLT